MLRLLRFAVSTFPLARVGAMQYLQPGRGSPFAAANCGPGPPTLRKPRPYASRSRKA